MKSVLGLCIFAVASTLAVITSTASTTTAESIKANEGVRSTLRLLESWLDARMTEEGWPGLAIGIVYDQDLIWSRGFGYADIEEKTPVTDGTLFRIASNSKMFTSIGLLQLRDAGKLQLDDPVAKHLSWFKIKQRFTNAGPITIRHLLTHTAGMPRESPHPYWTDFQFPDVEEVKRTLARQETIYPPEERWKYSNLGMTILGEVIAKVSGQPYEDYIRERILEPLGMRHTLVTLTEANKPANLAIGYGRREPDGERAPLPFNDIKAITAAGGLASSVEDLARFVSLQFSSNSSVLPARTLREMHRVHWLHPNWQGGWGLGVSVTHTEQRDIVGHSGRLAGYRSGVYFSPKEKIGVIVLINCIEAPVTPAIPDSIPERVFSWIAPKIKAMIGEGQPREAKPGWSKFAGKYRSIWGDAEVLIYNGELTIVDPFALDPASSMSVLREMKDNIFRLEDSSYGPHGELVEFVTNGQGEVARIKLGENYMEKLPSGKW